MRYLKHPWFFLLLSLIITIAVKIPHLGLPYFFDEAFSYIPAIEEMAQNGPNLLPGTISLYSSKGHPLFFYFLASLWLKFIAGNSIVLMRLFPLIISLASLVVFHFFAKRHTNLLLANLAVLLLSVQPLFLAQASLVLPEIFLFILFMLTFDSYLSSNYGRYAFFGALTMLTKETGAVFTMVFGLAYLMENYTSRNTRIFWRNLFMMAIPMLVYLLFLVLHYLKFGVIFYTDHLNCITGDKAQVLYKFKSAISTLFLAHGRNLVFFTAILALIILLVRKRKITYLRLMLISFAVILFFLVFTILNFYTYRYLLPVMGISLLTLLSLVQQIKLKQQAVNIAYTTLIIGVSAYYTATKRGHSDADLGYTEFLVVYQKMVKYCEQQKWYDKKFGTSFNMFMAMRDHHNRYLSTDRNFFVQPLSGNETPIEIGADMIIFDSTCSPGELLPEEKNKLILLKRFDYKKHWGEIYSVPSVENAQLNQ